MLCVAVCLFGFVVVLSVVCVPVFLVFCVRFVCIYIYMPVCVFCVCMCFPGVFVCVCV